MLSKSLVVKPLVAAALLATAGVSQAALTVYTSQASFLAAVTAVGVDSFADFSVTGTTPSPITRSAGPYTYTASASTSSFYGAGTTSDPALSTNFATDFVTFSGFSGNVSAIGGNFFGTDILGGVVSGTMTLVATDSLGATISQPIVGASASSFLGFVSTGTMTSLVLSAVQPASPLWPTTDNLTLAVAVVPEPGTYALMLGGLALLGAAARRRRG